MWLLRHRVFEVEFTYDWGFPAGAGGKEPTCQCRRCKRCWFDPWVGKIPWRKKWQPTPIFLLGESHGQRSLTGYSPQDRRDWDTTLGLVCLDLVVFISPFIFVWPIATVKTVMFIQSCNIWGPSCFGTWVRFRRGACGPWVRKVPWSRKLQPTPYSCLGNCMDRRARWAPVHGSDRHNVATKLSFFGGGAGLGHFSCSALSHFLQPNGL